MSELELGVAAFNDARYQEALEHLRRAVALDPSARVGHLYLARACEDAYIESESFPENDQLNVCAITEYAWILERGPLDPETMNAMAHRYYVTRHFDDAERAYRMVLETDPLDSEALYTLAVIQWTRSYTMRQEKRVELGIGRKKPLIASPACKEIRTANLSRVEEAISLLTTATQHLNSFEVMRYMAIVYRERADIQCSDRPAYKKDMQTAREWDLLACKAARTQGYRRLPSRWPAAPPPPPPDRPGLCPN